MRHNKINTIGIYCITCVPNNRKYIGQSLKIEVRVRGHFSKLKLNKHNSDKFQKDFNEFGEENFKWEILKSFSLVNLDDLDICEKHFIAKYKSNDESFGYNSKLGGIRNKAESEIKKMNGHLSYVKLELSLISKNNKKKRILKQREEYISNRIAKLESENNKFKE